MGGSGPQRLIRALGEETGNIRCARRDLLTRCVLSRWARPQTLPDTWYGCGWRYAGCTSTGAAARAPRVLISASCKRVGCPRKLRHRSPSQCLRRKQRRTPSSKKAPAPPTIPRIPSPARSPAVSCPARHDLPVTAPAIVAVGLVALSKYLAIAPAWPAFKRLRISFEPGPTHSMSQPPTFAHQLSCVTSQVAFAPLGFHRCRQNPSVKLVSRGGLIRCSPMTSRPQIDSDSAAAPRRSATRAPEKGLGRADSPPELTGAVAAALAPTRRSSASEISSFSGAGDGCERPVFFVTVWEKFIDSAAS